MPTVPEPPKRFRSSLTKRSKKPAGAWSETSEGNRPRTEDPAHRKRVHGHTLLEGDLPQNRDQRVKEQRRSRQTREEQLAAFAENWDIDLSQNGFEKAAAKALGTVVEDEAFSQLAGNIVYVVSDDGYQTLLYDEVFNEELIEEMGRAFKRRLRCNSRSIEVFREEARRFLAASDDSDEEASENGR